MKKYLKPDAELILLTPKEAIAGNQGGTGNTGDVSDPFGGWSFFSTGRRDDPDDSRR